MGINLTLWLQLVAGGMFVGLGSLSFLLNLPSGDYHYRFPPEIQRAMDLIEDDDFMWTDEGRPRRSWTLYELQHRVDNLQEAADTLRRLRHYWTYEKRHEQIKGLEDWIGQMVRRNPGLTRRPPPG